MAPGVNHRNASATPPDASRRALPCTPPAHRTRPVSISDEELLALAARAKAATEWDELLLSARVGPGRWKIQHVAGDFGVYTRQESQRYEVLAVGQVVGCAGEIMNILQCQNSAQYAQQMEGIFEDQFKDGTFIYQARRPRQAAAASDADATLTELTVKTVTFSKNGWLASHEEWCYVDAVYRHNAAGKAEKLMTTLEPRTIVAGLSSTRTKHFHGVTCAYLLTAQDGEEKSTMADEPPKPVTPNQDENGEATASAKPPTNKRTTRVQFYGEFIVPKQFGLHVPAAMSASASNKTIKQRLVKLADSCARLETLVRRQRLGVQGVIDYLRFMPPTNTPCMVCTKMLLVAKVCRLCGMGVCSDCSMKYERATQPKGSDSLHDDKIRVCADCMFRVDRADYSNLTPSSLQGPHIVPDPEDAPPAETVLRSLLHDALLKAPSPTRKAGVMSVIKCVLEQERGDHAAKAPSPVELTPTSSEQDYLNALEYLEVDPFPRGEPPVRSHDDRCYQMDASNPGSALNAPLAEREDDRLRAVQQIDMDQLCESVELNILCHLAAAEMDCSTSTISIFDRDSLNCVATNVSAYARLKLPRWNTMCAHTILDKRPHLIPHPESDIRMADALVVTGFGVRFYFAFPVVDASGEIMGSFCVMNETFHEITESQFCGFQKLAETCNKVVRVHAEQRRKSSVTSSSGDSYL